MKWHLNHQLRFVNRRRNPDNAYDVIGYSELREQDHRHCNHYDVIMSSSAVADLKLQFHSSFSGNMFFQTAAERAYQMLFGLGGVLEIWGQLFKTSISSNHRLNLDKIDD